MLWKGGGVRLMGIGRILQSLLANKIFSVVGSQTKELCGSVKLYVGIEEGIHGLRDIKELGRVETAEEQWTLMQQEEEVNN